VDPLLIYKKNPDPFTAATIISQYTKQPTVNIDNCYAVYNTLKEAKKPLNVFVYSTLINACRKAGKPRNALALLDEMETLSVDLNNACLKMLISVCMDTGDARAAERLLQKMKSNKITGQSANNIDCTLLIKTFQKANKPQLALEVLKYMDVHKIQPDAVTYTFLLKSCVSLSQVTFVHDHIIETHCKLDQQLQTTLIHMYAKFEAHQQLLKLFESFENQTKKHTDVVLWNIIINTCIQLSKLEEAIHFYYQMLKEGVIPSEFTYSYMLKVCTITKNIELGKSIHKQLKMNHKNLSPILLVNLISMYSECDALHEVELLVPLVQYIILLMFLIYLENQKMLLYGLQ
jgi:pentatricopeptide repeat protein